MEWINKIDLGEYATHKEALDESLNIIKNWCEDNDYEFRLSHNTYVGGTGKDNTNFNRVVFIKTERTTYGYKLIISYYYKKIGYEEVESLSIFGSKTEKQAVYDKNKTWYGRLERMY